MTEPFFPRLADPDDGEAIRVGDDALTYRELAGAAAAVADRVSGSRRVAVWAEPTLELCVTVVGALAAGVSVVPINPGLGSREDLRTVAHGVQAIALNAEQDGRVLTGEAVHEPADRSERSDGRLPDELGAEDDSFVMYTSGTTGPPKGVQIPRRAVASNLDALADIWQWTCEDRLTHALPMFHVHGLVIGMLGPLRRGGRLEHAGRFSPAGLAGAVRRGATMMFGVPTMYGRIAREAAEDAELVKAFASVRVLISGSAALPTTVHDRIKRLTGQSILERYGLTETLMNAGVRLGEEVTPGRVGGPLPGVELRLIAEDGTMLETEDDETIGEVAVRGPNLFKGYLNQSDATAEAMRDGWFMTGDLATRDASGSIRLVGRKSTDLIKSGGYRIGAGEIEGALLEHPAVAEVAVTARPDEDLGERIVAWVVAEPGQRATADELADHVSNLLTKHKRPREVHFVDELPRNAMGKVMKRDLTAGSRDETSK